MSNTQFFIALCAYAATVVYIAVCRKEPAPAMPPQPATDHTHTNDNNTSRLVAIAELLLIHQIARTDPDAARIAAARYAVGCAKCGGEHKTPDLPDEIKEQLRRQYKELARVERENEAADLGNPIEPEPRNPRGTILAGFGPL